jgi:hypothetical protein
MSRFPLMQRILTPARTLLEHRSLVVLLGCCMLLGLAISFVGQFQSMFGTQVALVLLWIYRPRTTAASL